MAQTKQAKHAYRVLCWGACKQDGAGPCSLFYPPGRVAVEGDVVSDLPVQSIQHEIAAGHIEVVEAPAEDGNE
jgi:hypothetical protein